MKEGVENGKFETWGDYETPVSKFETKPTFLLYYIPSLKLKKTQDSKCRKFRGKGTNKAK